MLEVIAKIDIDPTNWDLTSLTQDERIHSSGFQIASGLRVNFDPDSGGKIAFSAVCPEISSPHYRIKPIEMGAALWYSLEYDIAGEHLHNVGQIIPTLDASSSQSTTLFSLLRIFYNDGRSEDISSLQVEIRRNRTNQTFPISLDDLSSLSRGEIRAARLIFFIEARNVPLDIYGLTIISVPTVKLPYRINQIKRMRDAHAAGVPSIKRGHLDANVEPLSTGRCLEHRQISPGVFLDFQPGDDRHITVTRQAEKLLLDFSEASSGGWRSLEFRFEEVRNTGSISALVFAKGGAMAKYGLEAGLVLREYDANFLWEDTPLPVSLTLFSEERSELRLFDLSPLLSDKRDLHHFGIMVFLPQEAGMLEVEEMDVFVFDREII